MKTSIFKIAALLCCTLSLFNFSSKAQDGSLDLSFNSTGKVLTPMGTFDDAIYDMAIQSDGKIVTVGHTYQGSVYNFGLARYNVDGSLDNTFDVDGKKTTNFFIYDSKANAVAIQNDGKIVVAGQCSDGTTPRFALARFNTDGSLDTSFDSDGKVNTIVGTTYSYAYSVAIQSDGKILAAGYGYNGTNQNFAVVRYNSNGSLDTSFDSDGIVYTDFAGFGDLANGIAIQSDGKILLAGFASLNVAQYHFALVRYNINGSIDSTFDNDGKVITQIGGTNQGYINTIKLQNDGKIVVAGNNENSFFDFVLARYNTNGSLDNSFGSNGIVNVDYENSSSTDKGQAAALQIQNDGKIVIAGLVTYGANMNFAVLKFLEDGTPDLSFDSDGIVTTSFFDSDGANAVAIQTDGKIIAAGQVHDGTQNHFGLARYLNTIEIENSISKINGNKIQLNIYPNPSLHYCVIESEKKLNNVNILLTNVLGQIVYEQINVSGNKFKLNYPNLATGQYFINFTSNIGTFLAQKKIIIE